MPLGTGESQSLKPVACHGPALFRLPAAAAFQVAIGWASNRAQASLAPIAYGGSGTRPANYAYRAMPGNRGNVLVVEDNPDSAALLADLVDGEGFRSLICTTAAEAMTSHEAFQPIGILLDWGLPDRPGIEVCREIRGRDQEVLIIFISARTDETAMARGFEAGADDYVTKPIRGGELMARFEAHLRRAEARRTGAASSHRSDVDDRRLKFGPIDVDLQARQVRRAGAVIKLSSLEFKLLEYLLLNAGIAVSRDQILNNVYGYDAEITSDRVDLLVRRLRGKLGEREEGGHIVAVTGYGYRFDRRSATDRS